MLNIQNSIIIHDAFTNDSLNDLFVVVEDLSKTKSNQYTYFVSSEIFNTVCDLVITYPEFKIGMLSQTYYDDGEHEKIVKFLLEKDTSLVSKKWEVSTSLSAIEVLWRNGIYDVQVYLKNNT
jgi:hypothetical protein